MSIKATRAFPFTRADSPPKKKKILALSRYYKVPIHVIQSQNPKIVAHSPDPKAMATLTPAKAKKIKACRIS